MNQKANLYQPIVADRPGPAPLTLRVGVQAQSVQMVEGVPPSPLKGETYVLLSALPEELRRRVELAVQAMVAGV